MASRATVIWLSIAVAIATLTFFWEGWLLYEDRLELAKIQPGTAIRPMLEMMDLGIAGFASFVLGGICALVAFILSIIRKRWVVAIGAVLVGILSWLPLPAGTIGLKYLMSQRNLTFDD